jgi:hypothetical protein
MYYLLFPAEKSSMDAAEHAAQKNLDCLNPSRVPSARGDLRWSVDPKQLRQLPLAFLLTLVADVDRFATLYLSQVHWLVMLFAVWKRSSNFSHTCSTLLGPNLIFLAYMGQVPRSGEMHV